MICAFDEWGKCFRCGYVTPHSGLVRNCRSRKTRSAKSFSAPPTIADLGPLPEAIKATSAADFGVPSGPGTELKKLLAGWPFYITATPDCSCNERAAEMDRQGFEWCEQNIETVVGWLREQAHARGLPFLDAAGRMLVRRAIKNARKS